MWYNDEVDQEQDSDTLLLIKEKDSLLALVLCQFLMLFMDKLMSPTFKAQNHNIYLGSGLRGTFQQLESHDK